VKRIITVIALAAMTLTLAVVAQADTNHGRPVCTAPPMDETSHGSRDGFDDFHVSHPSFVGSLADLEGYLNVCRTNDNPVVEGASASAEVFRGRGVVRVQLRAQLQQWRDTDPAPGFQGGWVTVDQSDSLNTGVNLTMAVTTPFHTVNQPTSPLTQGWTRTVVRALVRYGSNTGPLVFYVRTTYPIWVDDGPVTALP
jgi:hypothetical protein